jgi:hypothetical protein
MLCYVILRYVILFYFILYYYIIYYDVHSFKPIPAIQPELKLQFVLIHSFLL